MKQEEVNRIQSDLYEAFVKLDAFCRAQNIRYYFLGGTMLGAVRHQGFIPWDDDIDIGIPRRDYKRLLTLFGNQTIEGFSVYNFQTAPSCSFDFTKLMHTQKSEATERKIFIDVFPLDGCPFSSDAMIRVYFWMFNVLRILKNSHYMSLEGKGALKRIVVLAARKISLSRWNALMDRFLERHDFDTSTAGGNFSGHWAAKEIMRRSVYGKPTPIRFQDGMFLGVEQPDLYLRRMYGDYMKMPSEEERLSHFS